MSFLAGCLLQDMNLVNDTENSMLNVLNIKFLSLTQ